MERRSPRASADLESEELFTLVQVYLDNRTRRRDSDQDATGAWDRFFALVDPLIRRIAKSRSGNRADVEDKVQEIWIAILSRFPRIRGRVRHDRPAGLLAVIARHAVSDHDRLQSHRPLLRLAGREEENLPGKEPSPADRAESEEACRLVRATLEELRRQCSETSFQLIYLHWIEEKSFEEIAAIFDCTTKQVRDRHRRVLLKLGSLIRDSIHEDRL